MEVKNKETQLSPEFYNGILEVTFGKKVFLKFKKNSGMTTVYLIVGSKDQYHKYFTLTEMNREELNWAVEHLITQVKKDLINIGIESVVGR